MEITKHAGLRKARKKRKINDFSIAYSHRVESGVFIYLFIYLLACSKY